MYVDRSPVLNVSQTALQLSESLQLTQSASFRCALLLTGHYAVSVTVQAIENRDDPLKNMNFNNLVDSASLE